MRSILRSGYVHSCEPLRIAEASGARWASFIALPIAQESKFKELEKLLGARHIFQTTPGEYCRTSLKENGAATLLCGSKFSFLKNNATALDVLSRYGGARVFPMGDLYFRISFKEHTAFPKFVEFLRGANTYLKTNLFIYE